MTVDMKTLRERWMADAAFRDAYERIGPEMEIAFAIAEARHRAGLTQAELAERIGSSQAMVARWENGRSMPATRTLAKVAEATGSRLRIALETR